MAARLLRLFAMPDDIYLDDDDDETGTGTDTDGYDDDDGGGSDIKLCVLEITSSKNILNFEI